MAPRTRPTLVYSPKSAPSTSATTRPTLSSRTPSRASTPPSTSYYASLDGDAVGTLERLSREEYLVVYDDDADKDARSRSASPRSPSYRLRRRLRRLQRRPSVAAFLHYVSLGLSLRLLLSTPTVSLLAATLLLVLTLEGRAKVEKLGLGAPVTAVLAVVCVGMAVANARRELVDLATLWVEQRSQDIITSEVQSCGLHLKPLWTESVRLHHHPTLVTICTPRGAKLRPDAATQPLAGLLQAQLSEDGNRNADGKLMSSAYNLCKHAARLFKSPQSAQRHFRLQMTFEPEERGINSVDGLGVESLTVACNSGLYSATSN